MHFIGVLPVEGFGGGGGGVTLNPKSFEAFKGSFKGSVIGAPLKGSCGVL